MHSLQFFIHYVLKVAFHVKVDYDCPCNVSTWPSNAFFLFFCRFDWFKFYPIYKLYDILTEETNRNVMFIVITKKIVSKKLTGQTVTLVPITVKSAIYTF